MGHCRGACLSTWSTCAITQEAVIAGLFLQKSNSSLCMVQAITGLFHLYVLAQAFSLEPVFADDSRSDSGSPFGYPRFLSLVLLTSSTCPLGLYRQDADSLRHTLRLKNNNAKSHHFVAGVALQLIITTPRPDSSCRTVAAACDDGKGHHCSWSSRSK